MSGRERKAAYYEGRGLGSELIDLYFDRLGHVERVLDIGCGTGSFLRGGMAREVEVIGIDIDIGALDHANSFGDVALVDLQNGTLPFADASFDGVVAKDVLEHLCRPESVVSELHRVLRPGGRAVVSVPMAKPKVVWQDYTHIRGFTENAVRMMLSDQGFSIESVDPMGGVPGAGRFGLTQYLPRLLRIPWFRCFAVSHEVVVSR